MWTDPDRELPPEGLPVIGAYWSNEIEAWIPHSVRYMGNHYWREVLGFNLGPPEYWTRCPGIEDEEVDEILAEEDS